MAYMITIDDIENMIAKVGGGDVAAFSQLYDATSAKLFGVCLRVLTDRAEAEDALQEVYVKIWQKSGTYSANGYSPMTWLITIARNHAVDQLRARKAPTRDIDDVAGLADKGPTPEMAAIQSSQRAQINGCLDELDIARATAVRGAYLNGNTYQELADDAGVPINTMRTWLRRSLVKLRECLSR